MKTTIVKIYEESDYKLLSPRNVFDLPKNPCTKCLYQGKGCLGCGAERNYKRSWRPYWDAGINDIAEQLIERHNIQKKLSELQDRLDELESSIPSEFLCD